MIQGTGMAYGIAGGFQQAGQVGTLTSPCTPAREATPVECRINGLNSNLEELRSLVAGFQVKLQDVLTPEMKGETGNACSTPRPVASPLCDRLGSINADMTHSLSLLRGIFQRIEL